MSQKVAYVTGGMGGIGTAICQRLHKDGFKVIAGCGPTRDHVKWIAEQAALGYTFYASAGNVGDWDSTVEAFTKTKAEHGTIDVLVNNAGITRDNMLFKMTDDDWDSVIGVHLRGHFLMTQAAQKHMTQAKYGRIVNLSSTSALGNRGQANYAAAKAGVQGFTKTVAIELGKYGVTCNAIAPGFIETEMTAATAARVGISMEDFKNAAASMIPVARVGQPEDIAATVSFLVSEGAGFVSGQIIYVAGGPKD